MRKLCAVLLVVLLGGGCSWLPWPPTEPTPPPPCEVGSCDRDTEAPMMCVEGACVPCEPDLSDVPDWMDVDPPSCSTPERPVKHWPPESECPKLTDPCQAPPLPQPQCPTFTDRGGTLQPMAFPDGREPCGCYIGHEFQECPEPPPEECVTESDLVAVDCPTPGANFQDEVKLATDTLGDLRGRPPNENLDKLAAQLRTQMPGRCILSGIEAVFILRDDGTYEENHAVFFGNGSWTNSGRGRFIGCHRDTDPTEPVGCTDPDPRGRPAEFKLKRHGQLWDSTYRIKDRSYCNDVCSPIEPDVCFTGRNACPLRMEGDPEREVCEELMIGTQQWWCDGEPIDPKEGNNAQARCHGHVKTCTEDGVTCAQSDW